MVLVRAAPVRDFLVKLLQQVIGLALRQWQLDRSHIVIDLRGNLQESSYITGSGKRLLVSRQAWLIGCSIDAPLFQLVNFAAILLDLDRAHKRNGLDRIHG